MFFWALLIMVVSWDAWPKASQPRMTAEEDKLYKSILGQKKYMMGVSPYFYTSTQ